MVFENEEFEQVLQKLLEALNTYIDGGGHCEGKTLREWILDDYQEWLTALRDGNYEIHPPFAKKFRSRCRIAEKMKCIDEPRLWKYSVTYPNTKCFAYFWSYPLKNS